MFLLSTKDGAFERLKVLMEQRPEPFAAETRVFGLGGSAIALVDTCFTVRIYLVLIVVVDDGTC